MPPPSPLVTVVIPAFNRRAWLERAVHSVIAQTASRLELVVVDDGSTEDINAVRTLVESRGQRFLTQCRAGPAAARNRGVRVGSARWIAFLDSDDYWMPKKLARQLRFHAASPGYRISQTAERWIRHGCLVTQPTRYRHPSGWIFDQCVERCCLSCSSIMIDRFCFEEVGGFDTHYPVCEDYDLWLRLSHRWPIAWIPDLLTVKHGGHADQLSKVIPAMDRFRLHALLCRWRELPGHRPTLEAAIRSKAEILMQGARKRALPTSPYSDCLAWLLEQDGHERERQVDTLISQNHLPLGDFLPHHPPGHPSGTTSSPRK